MIINKKLILACGLFFGTAVFAADLTQVYQQALVSDPIFQEAQATWLAAKETLPISRALLLTQATLTGGLVRSRNKLSGGAISASTVVDDYYNNNRNYGLSITQPIFNYTNWMATKSAGNTVKQAEATFNAAAQSLMYRTANAYFAVLKAQDILRYTHAEKIAMWRELDQAQKKYNVGVIAITAVENAKAKYDGVVADEIAAQNDLDDQREKLREITKVYYTDLSPLVVALPLVTPDPIDIEKWVTISEKQNYTLQATRYGRLAAHDNIAVKVGGNYPVLNATAGYTNSRDDNYGGRNLSGTSQNMNAGLSLSFPLLQGGGTLAQTRQAEHQYELAVATEDKTHSQTTSNTRQAYLGVMSGISKVKADAQAVKSNESNLSATQAAYAAGTRTMVDVLDAEATLYDSQKTHATDQYTYILQTLSLKNLAGTLSPDDLRQVNTWLQKNSNPPTPVAKPIPSTKTKSQTVAKSFYTIQLTTDKKQKKLVKALENYQAKHQEICSFPQKNSHNLLLCGHYASVTDAKNLINRLPQNLRATQVKVIKKNT